MSTKRDLSRPDGNWNHHSVRIDDLDMHLVREGQGQSLILLHGWPEFWWGWHRNIPALAAHFDVIAPDLRGFGQTRVRGPEHAGADTHARDILALADALGLRRFGLVAHDVGSYVAQQVARLSPDRLSGLFFFNCPYPGIGRRWVDPEQVQEIWYQSFNQQPWAAQLVGHTRETCRIYFEGILRHWVHAQGALDGLIEHFVDNFMQPGNIESGFAWYRATNASRMALVRDGAPAMPKIEVPSRFYWGRHDPIIRCAWMDRLSEYFASPILEIAEGAGHFVHLETPGPSNTRIIEFFSRQGSTIPSE
ncbi:putative hydrolase or acyltransferase of alpha/beta superfamily protein [Bosea sp. LC85]|nr:putative hydrolase or acyltransferase of alpha/beta superfamily protein [Bosea sp. LC85]